MEKYIEAAGKRYEAENGIISISPHAGKEDHSLMGWMHYLCLYIAPINDGFPHLHMTDMELYQRGSIPKNLNGLRLDQSLETGDYSPPWSTLSRWLFKRPYIRPGSTVGMAMVAFQSPSATNSIDQLDPSKNLYLQNRLRLQIDHVEDDKWLVDIEVGYDFERDSIDDGYEKKEGGIEAGVFKARSLCTLEIEDY